MKAIVSIINKAKGYSLKGSYKTEYEWKSDKHCHALDGEPPCPEDDPLNLYGEYKTIYDENGVTVIEDSFNITLTTEKVYPNSIYSSDKYTYLATDRFTLMSTEQIKGKCPYKEGDEVEVWEIASALGNG